MKVALTFDAEYPDQPNWSRNEPLEDVAKIVDGLTQYGVPATFFIQGRWAQACPNAVAKIQSGGFTIGSHGFYHAPYALLTAKGAKADIDQASGVLYDQTGVVPELFRYPYGNVAHKSTVEAAGYDVVGWDYTPEDWTLDSWQVFVQRMQAAFDVVLLHTWPGPVSSHLKQYITDALDRGVEFVSLKEVE